MRYFETFHGGKYFCWFRCWHPWSHGQVMGKYVWSSQHCWKSLYWPKKSSNGNTTIPLYDTVDGCEILHQVVTIGRYEHCLPSINYIYIYVYDIYIYNPTFEHWTWHPGCNCSSRPSPHDSHGLTKAETWIHSHLQHMGWPDDRTGHVSNVVNHRYFHGL